MSCIFNFILHVRRARALITLLAQKPLTTSNSPQSVVRILYVIIIIFHQENDKLTIEVGLYTSRKKMADGTE